ncbi:alanine racemase [Aliikangiella sp. IMCC44359]|uniref:alanine racemase n=1 Tax=Aliikangiella sp. IMCC44359 TaxID=3459125 RepID=UPI00403A9CD0
MRSTRAIINLKAVKHNVSIVKQLAPGCKIMAVVKADAYGHGIVQVANCFTDVEAIAVACMDEAIKLREAAITKPIILLEGFFSQGELRQAIEYDLQTVVHQESQLLELEKLSAKILSATPDYQLKVWLKLDSGMNRLGFEEQDFIEAYQRIKQIKVVDTVNLMSHLACADDIKNLMSKEQIKKFNITTKGMQGLRSMANSAGVVAWPESHYDWVRPGIILYGCSPMLGINGLAHHLQPAMTLESQLFAIRNLKPGDKVGYGSAWTAQKSTKIGVIAIGYGDGYPRHAKEGTPVWIEGKTYPLVGKVSMDMITVDLGADCKLDIGSKAVLWGEGLPVETIAEFANTIPYTLLCGVTSRVKFKWKND